MVSHPDNKIFSGKKQNYQSRKRHGGNQHAYYWAGDVSQWQGNAYIHETLGAALSTTGKRSKTRLSKCMLSEINNPEKVMYYMISPLTFWNIKLQREWKISGRHRWEGRGLSRSGQKTLQQSIPCAVLQWWVQVVTLLENPRTVQYQEWAKLWTLTLGDGVSVIRQLQPVHCYGADMGAGRSPWQLYFAYDFAVCLKWH